jgi:hypothetical protein
MERAACRGEDPSVFFPGLGGTTTKARAICSVCPVRQGCLEYALADTELAGVFGGTSERERRKLRAADAGPTRVLQQTDLSKCPGQTPQNVVLGCS